MNGNNNLPTGDELKKGSTQLSWVEPCLSSLSFIVRACRELPLLILAVSILFFISPTKAFASATRTTTYIGNYEVTEEDGVGKKEVVRVAGAMDKVVKSKVDGRKWEYSYYTTDIQGSTRQEITQTQINNHELVEGPNTYYAYGTPIPMSSSSAGSSNLNAQTQKVEDTYTGQKKDRSEERR